MYKLHSVLSLNATRCSHIRQEERIYIRVSEQEDVCSEISGTLRYEQLQTQKQTLLWSPPGTRMKTQEEDPVLSWWKLTVCLWMNIPTSEKLLCNMDQLYNRHLLTGKKNVCLQVRLCPWPQWISRTQRSTTSDSTTPTATSSRTTSTTCWATAAWAARTRRPKARRRSWPRPTSAHPATSSESHHTLSLSEHVRPFPPGRTEKIHTWNEKRADWQEEWRGL